MARVKNITRETVKKIPRAVFGDVIGTDKTKTVSCDGCGLVLRRGNLARHRKRCGQCQGKSRDWESS